ncbi:MAG: NAD(+) diphosphatase [Flavobacteriaceae bacterium]
MDDDVTGRMGFARSFIDRQALLRANDAEIAAMLRRSEAQFYLFAGERVLVQVGAAPQTAGFAAEHAVALMSEEPPVFLGMADGRPLFAAAAIEEMALPDTIKPIDIRSIAMQGLLPEGELGALAQGRSMLHWHATHRYCSRCGHESVPVQGGYRRDCGHCGAQHFPRTDPVSIMLIVNGDNCLLGRSGRFAAPMYSTLAGFIEPGETIEDAVRRETMEEAGVRVGKVAYLASQPWPFPASLMIGCYGQALSEDIVIDREELMDARWFSRADIGTMLAGKHPEGLVVPQRFSIAHQLIWSWMEGKAAI